MEHVKLLIVGAGAAGLSAAVSAWNAGCRDILIADRALKAPALTEPKLSPLACGQWRQPADPGLVVEERVAFTAERRARRPGQRVLKNPNSLMGLTNALFFDY